MTIKLFAAALLAAASTPAFAQEQSDKADNRFDGFRIEARATYETPTVSSVNVANDVYKLGSAFAFGGEIGADLAASDKIAVGAYGQYEFSSVESCDGTFCLKAKDYFEAGLHVGYAVGDKGQLYGKVGYGRLALETTGPSSSEDGSGFAFALGYEHSFAKHFYGRVEGGYADVGQIYGYNFQRRHAGIALGTRF